MRFTRLGGGRTDSGIAVKRRTEEAALPGEIVHIEIPADDTQRSQEFWGSLFGWQFQANPGPFEYHTTQVGGEQGAAITNMEPGKRGTRPYFAVDDIKAGAVRAAGSGAEGTFCTADTRHCSPILSGGRLVDPSRVTVTSPVGPRSRFSVR